MIILKIKQNWTNLKFLFWTNFIMISMLLWLKTDEKNKTKHSIWFSRRYNNSIFHSILPLKTTTIHLILYKNLPEPPILLLNYILGCEITNVANCNYAGNHCQPVNTKMYTKMYTQCIQKCCTKCIRLPNEWSKYHITTYYSIWIMKFWFKKKESL